MTARRVRFAVFLFGGLLVSLVLAGGVSNVASGSPDGLDSATLNGCTLDDRGQIVSGDCPAREAGDHELANSPLADYGIKGVENDLLSTALSGVVGVLATFGIGGALFWLVRRRPRESADSGSSDG
jgi:cobalt/nickel transport protein